MCNLPTHRANFLQDGHYWKVKNIDLIIDVIEYEHIFSARNTCDQQSIVNENRRANTDYIKNWMFE